MASKFFNAIIESVSAFNNEKREKGSTGLATFNEVFSGGQEVPSSMTAQYVLPEDTTSAERNKTANQVSRVSAEKLMSDIRTTFSAEKNMTIAQLSALLTGATTVGRKRTTTERVQYALDSTEDIAGSSSLIETIGGAKRRATTLRPLMEDLMQQYVVEDMTRPSAPLHFRSGRFASSTAITDITTTKSKSGRDTLSVYYTYMTHPYSVFDPAVSDYRDLSSAGRNPRRIIGQAIEKTLRDLVAKRYNIQIRQRG